MIAMQADYNKNVQLTLKDRKQSNILRNIHIGTLLSVRNTLYNYNKIIYTIILKVGLNKQVQTLSFVLDFVKKNKQKIEYLTNC